MYSWFFLLFNKLFLLRFKMSKSIINFNYCKKINNEIIEIYSYSLFSLIIPVEIIFINI